MLFYPGFDVLPPFVIHRSSRVDAAGFDAASAALGERLDTLFETQPIPFRRQNGGDYEIPALTLREEIAPGRSGFGVHLA